MFRVIEAAQQPTQAWKNGGGSTTQIASHPPDAGLDAFDWRVSMARVETDGPFSLFPGIDRTLAILDGDGVGLQVDGVGEITVTQAGPPASFPGDRATFARLIGGPVTDLNVMTRRGRFGHRLQTVLVEGTQTMTFDSETVVALCLDDLRVRLGKEDQRLKAGDAAVLAGTGAVTLFAGKTARVWLVRIQALAGA